MPAGRPPPQRQLLRLWQQAERLLRQGLGAVHRLPARDGGEPTHRDAHLHPIPTLIACLDGVMRVSYARGAITLVPGSAVIVAPGAWHHHEPLRPGACGYWQGLMPHHSDAELLDPDARHYLRLPLEPSRRLLYELLAAEDGEQRRRLGNALLGQIIDSSAETAVLPPALERMVSFFWRNLHRPIAVAQIFHASGLGQRQAHRLFTAYFGSTPKQALLECHLQLAEQHLHEGAAVGAAALASGFRDRDDLTRAWRRRFGSPPSAARTAG